MLVSSSWSEFVRQRLGEWMVVSATEASVPKFIFTVSPSANHPRLLPSPVLSAALTQNPLPSARRSLVTVPVSDLHCCSWPLPIKTGQGCAQSCLRRLSGCWTHAALAPLCKSSLYFLWLLPTGPFAPKESEIKSGSHMLKFHDALSVSLGRRRTTWELGFEPGFVGMGRHRFLRCVTQSDG